MSGTYISDLSLAVPAAAEGMKTGIGMQDLLMKQQQEAIKTQQLIDNAALLQALDPDLRRAAAEAEIKGKIAESLNLVDPGIAEALGKTVGLDLKLPTVGSEEARMKSEAEKRYKEDFPYFGVQLELPEFEYAPGYKTPSFKGTIKEFLDTDFEEVPGFDKPTIVDALGKAAVAEGKLIKENKKKEFSPELRRLSDEIEEISKDIDIDDFNDHAAWAKAVDAEFRNRVRAKLGSQEELEARQEEELLSQFGSKALRKYMRNKAVIDPTSQQMLKNLAANETALKGRKISASKSATRTEAQRKADEIRSGVSKMILDSKGRPRRLARSIPLLASRIKNAQSLDPQTARMMEQDVIAGLSDKDMKYVNLFKQAMGSVSAAKPPGRAGPTDPPKRSLPPTSKQLQEANKIMNLLQSDQGKKLKDTAKRAGIVKAYKSGRITYDQAIDLSNKLGLGKQ